MTHSCPNCSGDLTGRACKLRCTRCGYFESCSDLEAYPSEVGTACLTSGGEGVGAAKIGRQEDSSGGSSTAT